MYKSIIPTLSYAYKLNIQKFDQNFDQHKFNQHKFNQHKFRRLFNDYEGVDQRYPFLNNTTISDPNEIKQIASNFYKLDLLNKLKSDKINSFDKLNLIKISNSFNCLNNLSDEIKPINIKSGGLFKDWDYEF
jgi:hypothetical protein